MSNSTGVDLRTIKSWISVLEASYIIFLLKPFHRNFSKKLVKTPKLYFYDPGLLCYLLRIREEDITFSPYRGQLFESMIICEVKKYNMNHRVGFDFYFWRDNKGVEVDLLFEKANKLYSIEIKSSETILSDFFKNLKTFQEYAGSEHGKSFLIYAGDESQRRSYGQVLPWSKRMNTLFGIST